MLKKKKIKPLEKLTNINSNNNKINSNNNKINSNNNKINSNSNKTISSIHNIEIIKNNDININKEILFLNNQNKILQVNSKINEEEYFVNKMILSYFTLYTNLINIHYLNKYNYNIINYLYRADDYHDIQLYNNKNILYFNNNNIHEITLINNYKLSKENKYLVYISGRTSINNCDILLNSDNIGYLSYHYNSIIKRISNIDNLTLTVVNNKENFYIKNLCVFDISNIDINGLITRFYIDYTNTITNKKYDMIIIIPIHYRFNILDVLLKNVFTNINISIGVILIYSDNNNYTYCKNIKDTYKDVHFFWCNNKVSSKFDMAISYLKLFNYDTVMILGSDDIVLHDYIYTSYQHVINNIYDIYCTKNFKVKNMDNNMVYDFTYINENSNFPIGAGKVFSKKYLEYFKYSIFDTSLLNNLDTTMHIMLNNSPSYKYKLIPYTNLLITLKQGSNQMNNINKILQYQYISNNYIFKQINNDIISNIL